MNTQHSYPHSGGFPDIVREEIQQAGITIKQMRAEIKKVIIGHDGTIDLIFTAILCNGHVLLEGMPGVAKTTLIKTITDILGLDFKRIQFTPDLLPADLIGTMVFNQKTGDFEPRKGPVFAHIVLADEINRAPAKVQSALLEAMQEHQVTIGNETYRLDEPFLVFATQNPIEQEGTYSLPEAQIDRFMFKLIMGYPSREQEKELLQNAQHAKRANRVLSREELQRLQGLINSVYLDELVVDYITKIVAATRNPAQYGCPELGQFIRHGASPRATLALAQTSRAYAFLNNRHFVTPDDVKTVAMGILRHRLILSFEAEAEGYDGDAIIKMLLSKVPVP